MIHVKTKSKLVYKSIVGYVEKVKLLFLKLIKLLSPCSVMGLVIAITVFLHGISAGIVE